MIPIRQTRQKTDMQSTSFQSNKDVKEKQRELEEPNTHDSSSASPDKSPEKKVQSHKQKKPLAQDNIPTETSSSEYLPETHKNLINSHSYSEDHLKSSGALKRIAERTSPKSNFSDDLSEEVKKQIEMLFEIAQSSASKGDYNQAINIYNKIVKLNGKSTPALIAIGHCYAMLGDNYKALASYQQALSITPDSQKDDQLWYGIGLLYKKIEDWKNAESSFRNALKLNPSPAIKGEILSNLGTIMVSRGNPKEGARMLMNSILIGSFSVDKMVEILCAVGQAQEEADEINEALKAYKHAFTLDETNLKALQCAGWLSFQIEKTGEALEYLIRASLISDEDPNITYMISRCYLKTKQYSKAYESLHKCITKEPKNSTFWCSLGILFAEMNQVKSAHECFTNALHFNPTNAENFFNMGCLYELCSQPVDAIVMHEKAIELQPNFQLAYTRKLGVFAQIENNDNGHLEVQFKHHKFTPKVSGDMQKDKSVFLPSNDNSRNNNRFNSNMLPSYTESESINLHNLELLNALKNQNQLKPKDHTSDYLPNSSYLLNGGLKKPEIGNSLSSLQNELSSLLAMNSKSFGSENKIVAPFQQHDMSLPSLGHKARGGSTKLLSPENASTSKENNSFLINSSVSEKSKNNTSHPIVLKHDPQNMQIENKKGGFKLAHKPQRTEEDPAPQKKLKTDISSGNGSPQKHEVGSKKVPSLVLTSSLLKN